MMEGSYAFELMQQGKRVDKRSFGQFREIEIKTNVIGKAEGSAYVKLGDTQVIAGVKMGIGTPFADTPNEGVLIVNTEFTPMASPKFESGPPGEDAVELARVVDRGIRESKTIDMENLVIKPGEKVWTIFIDMHIIDHRGNLIDAAALAAINALLSARIPKADENVRVVPGEYQGKLPVMHKPVTVTVCKVGNNLFVDPTIEEECIIESKISVSVREDDKICAIQKQGSNGIEFNLIGPILDMAVEKAKELRKLG